MYDDSVVESIKLFTTLGLLLEARKEFGRPRTGNLYPRLCRWKAGAIRSVLDKYKLGDFVILDFKMT